MPNDTVIHIAGTPVTLSNLNKVLYPATGFTKGQVIDYYIRIAPVLLPHLINRPLTLKRYPNGSQGKSFYQKECPISRPPWVRTHPIWSESKKTPTRFCLIQDLPSLVWVANLAALELHTSLAWAENYTSPTLLVFDLDPGHPADLLDCAQVALWLKELLEEKKLVSFPKTSGSKGLQLYVPLNTPGDYRHTKSFAQQLARRLEKQHPDKVVSNMRKNLRQGKVFIDWSQNSRHKTTVCAYSLRAKKTPSVSTPLEWAEVVKLLEHRAPQKLFFTPKQVLERVAQSGDLFSRVLTLQQQIPPRL